MSVERLLDALEAHGCNPRQVGYGLWLAECPSCRAQGRFGLLEVHAPAEDPAAFTIRGCDPDTKADP